MDMENKPFYEFDLSKEDSLSEELEKLYDFSHNLENYKTVVYRGYNEEYVNKGFKKFNSYSEARAELDYLIDDWKINNPQMHLGQLNLSGEIVNWVNYPKIYKWIKNKTIELYGDEVIIQKFGEGERGSIRKIEIGDPLLTIYSKNCILTPHRDGTIYNPAMNFIKLANLLLYLNKDYKEDWGGCFIVEGKNVVVPTFGKIVFLNFRNGLDPEHEINSVLEDVNRVALLFNTTYKIREREIWNFE
jgi:hypothetical protein